MNQMLPRPKFWDDAAGQDQTRFTMLGELMVLWLLFIVAALGQSVLLTLFLLPWFFGEQGMSVTRQMMSGVDVEKVTDLLLRAMPDWMAICDSLAYAALGLVALLYCRRAQQRSPASMGLRGGFLPEYALGLLMGALLFCGLLGLGVWAEAYRLPRAPVISDRTLLLSLCALPACAVRGASVVLLIHGYFAPTIAKRYPVLAVLLISALASTMLQSSVMSLHGLNTLLLGLVLGLWTLKRGSLWGSCALYTAWLYGLNFLCCFAPAGKHSGLYLLAVETDTARSILTGASSGSLTAEANALQSSLGNPQAGICATVVLLAALMLLLPLQARDPAPPRPPQEEPDAHYL